jgi:hypothetical protein
VRVVLRGRDSIFGDLVRWLRHGGTAAAVCRLISWAMGLEGEVGPGATKMLLRNRITHPHTRSALALQPSMSLWPGEQDVEQIFGAALVGLRRDLALCRDLETGGEGEDDDDDDGADGP